MVLQDMKADRSLLASGEVDETEDSAVGLPLSNSQLAEVFVEGDQNPLLSKGEREDFFVTWVPVPIRGGKDVVAGRGELRAASRPDATVEEKPHRASVKRRGSILSWPTSRRAYKRQAWMSSDSSQGYPSRIVSGESPAANMPSTCSTARRRPRTIGLPPKMAGLNVIRSRSWCPCMGALQGHCSTAGTAWSGVVFQM